mmetsp:Transcript_3293/g.20499  ORF Transcript_3293/g.20499 Transcript_3293/m.20499 type:complete len:163 (+) Transcript_3293:1981-2469(+)
MYAKEKYQVLFAFAARFSQVFTLSLWTLEASDVEALQNEIVCRCFLTMRTSFIIQIYVRLAVTSKRDCQSWPNLCQVLDLVCIHLHSRIARLCSRPPRSCQCHTGTGLGIWEARRKFSDFCFPVEKVIQDFVTKCSTFRSLDSPCLDVVFLTTLELPVSCAY